MTIYHINYWSQVDYCKHFRKLWNGPFCWNKSRCSSPLVSVATFWKSSNTKACIKKLSEILENIIGNGGKRLVAEFIWGILSTTIFIFWNKFTQKGYFRSKGERVNMTIEFWIFELVQIQKFSLNWKYWSFRPNLSRENISSQKRNIAIELYILKLV